MTRLSRTIAALLIAPFLALASTLAPQHVHEAHSGHAVAHSHFAPHRSEVANTESEIEHDGEHVVWLDSPILHESVHQAAGAPLLFAIRALPSAHVPAADGKKHQSIDDLPPRHGPALAPPSHRGPPALV